MPLRVKKFIYLIEVDFSSCLFHNLACHGHFYSEELVAFAVLSGAGLEETHQYFPLLVVGKQSQRSQYFGCLNVAHGNDYK